MQKSILSALDMSHRDEKVVAYSRVFAKKWQLGIRIIHVVPTAPHTPPNARFLDSHVPINGKGGATLKTSPKTKERVERYMMHTARQLGPGTVSSIRYGCPFDMIMEEIKQGDYIFIVLGASDYGHSPLLEGDSCNLCLYNKSPVPVLTINKNSPLPNEVDKTVKFLVADDLIDDNHVVRFAAELKSIIKTATLFHHFHVSTPRTEYFASLLKLPIEARKREEAKIKANLAHLDSHLRHQLHERLSSQPHSAMKTVLCRGHVKEELYRHIRCFRPDFSIFGCHKPLHFNPTYPGRVSFDTVFALKRPFFIVP